MANTIFGKQKSMCQRVTIISFLLALFLFINTTSNRTKKVAQSLLQQKQLARTNAKPSTPRVLHQILPPDTSRYEAWIHSWTRSGLLERRTYGDEDLQEVVQALGSEQILAGWTEMARMIEKVDFVRYALLYQYGGVYADADQELINTTALERVLEWNTVALAFEQGGPWDVEQVGQALMISPPRHPFWWDLMEFMVDHYNSTCNVLLNTGPIGMTRFWNANGDKYQDVRLTKLLDGRNDPAMFNASSTLHHMGGTWVDPNHKAQLDACPDTMTRCDACEQRLYE